MRVAITRILCVFSFALALRAQLNVTGNIAASQVTSGTFNISLIPTGTTGTTVAIGNDTRFLNATSLNGTTITTLTGILKLTSGTPSNAAAADVIALWSGTCNASSYLRGDGACATPGGGGTVTTFSSGNLSPLFTTSVATATSTPALTFTLSTAAAHAFLGNNTGATAAPAYVQPAFTDISGTVAAGQLPNPSASTLGGVQSKAAVSNQFLTSISTSGVPASAQPAFSDLSGSATTGQIPTAVPVWSTYTVSYTNLSTAATTNAYTVVALTSKQILCGAVFKTATAFAGTGITGLVATLGDSNGTATTYIPGAYDLRATVSNTNVLYQNVVGAASWAGGNVQVNATASGANLNQLTAGSLSVSLCVATLP